MPNLNDFLSRIQTDHTFYLQFRRSPEEAFAPYELSAEERAALTESREQLRECLGQPNSYWKISCTHALLRSDECGFDVAAALARPEVQNIIGQIRKARRHADRLTPVLALMEEIG
jgi:hypothetical protein